MPMRSDGDNENGDFSRWALLSCAVVVFIPLVIHLLYALGDSCPLIISHWSAGDLLTYCGTLLAAAIAILGVYWSLRNNRREQEKQRLASKRDQERQIRDEAAPFFSAVFLTQRNKQSAFAEMLQGKLPGEAGENCGADKLTGCDDPYAGKYEEVDEREIYVILDGEISYKRVLSDDHVKHVRSQDLSIQSGPGAYSFGPNPVVYIPVNLINVGRGVAISMRIGVNPKYSEWSGVNYWTIEPGDCCYVGIYVDTSDEKVCGEYELRLVFFDYLGCSYMQRFELDIVRHDKGGGIDAQMAYYGPRELLSDKERERYLNDLEKSLSTFKAEGKTDES